MQLQLRAVNHHLFFFFILFLSTLTFSAEKSSEKTPLLQMTPQKLLKVIKSKVGKNGKVETERNLISFDYQDVVVFCVFDTHADRMRLVSPIAKVDTLPAEFIIRALQANYHTVLDPRYAIGDGLMYAAFIHPLSPLTTRELKSAIDQVVTANKTFGTDFTSGALVFPGQKIQQNESKKNIL